MTDKTYRVNVISLGTATIRAPSKAAAKRRAREDDFDEYELQEPFAAISSLDENEPVRGNVIPRPVVYRHKP